MLSRFAEEKGHRYMIEAVALLAAAHVDVSLRLAGGGHTLHEVQSQVRQLGIDDRVQFVGAVSSSADFYRELDAFVVPSVHSEGLPTTILEAMATGLPVIATDVGGAAEAIEDGTHGLIVPPQDPAALARAIRWLCDNVEHARRFGIAASRQVRAKFTVERMTRAIVEQVYAPLGAVPTGASAGT
jgi:glycosyltransferase involved in cell wall biosynthesis